MKRRHYAADEVPKWPMTGTTPLERYWGRPLAFPAHVTARGVFELRGEARPRGHYDAVSPHEYPHEVADYETGEDFTGRRFATYRAAALAKKHGDLPIVVEVMPDGSLKYALREGDLKILADTAVGQDPRFPRTLAGLRRVVEVYMSDEDPRWDDERRAKAVALLDAYLGLTPVATPPRAKRVRRTARV